MHHAALRQIAFMGSSSFEHAMLRSANVASKAPNESHRAENQHIEPAGNTVSPALENHQLHLLVLQ